MARTLGSSRPPERSRSVVYFLAPVGVSLVVMLVAAIVVLNQEPENDRSRYMTNRLPARSPRDAQQQPSPAEEESEEPPVEVLTPPVAAPPPPAPRRRGFSPVLSDEEPVEEEASPEASDEPEINEEESAAVAQRREEAKESLRDKLRTGQGFMGNILARTKSLRDSAPGGAPGR